MTNMSNKLPGADMSGRVILTTPSDREIVMTRVFDAPRQRVFDAWTKPELLRRWFGSDGWSVSVAEIDLRPGGSYRYVMHHTDGRQIVLRGEYRDVVPPERLVTTEVFEGFSEVGWRPEDATVTTAVLTERDGKTTWTATAVYPSKEVRDTALRSPEAWHGLDEGLDRLAELLAATA